MPTKFRVTDSRNKKYTIDRLPPLTDHIYSVKDSKGHYAEIKFDGQKWTERWNNAFVTKFDYDVVEIGNLIQEHFDF